MNMQTHYHQIVQSIREKALACGRNPQEVSLIAVSKTCSIESIQSVYQEGGREFGESRIQEALEKIPFLPHNCKWHFMGNLQSKKVGKAILAFHLIHSVDTPLLAQKISSASQAKGMTTSILLQVNTSGEKTKQGLSAEDWEHSLEEVNQLSNLKIEGLMTMAPYVEDPQIIRSCFRKLYQLRETWRQRMKDPQAFYHLSMGMSHDYLIAIEEGATLVRIGSAIFGPRFF